MGNVSRCLGKHWELLRKGKIGSEKNITILPLAKEKEATLSQVVIRWTIQQSRVTIALAATRNREQVVQLAGVANIDLNPGEIDIINEKLNKIL